MLLSRFFKFIKAFWIKFDSFDEFIVDFALNKEVKHWLDFALADSLHVDVDQVEGVVDYWRAVRVGEHFIVVVYLDQVESLQN